MTLATLVTAGHRRIASHTRATPAALSESIQRERDDLQLAAASFQKYGQLSQKDAALRGVSFYSQVATFRLELTQRA